MLSQGGAEYVEVELVSLVVVVVVDGVGVFVVIVVRDETLLAVVVVRPVDNEVVRDVLVVILVDVSNEIVLDLDEVVVLTETVLDEASVEPPDDTLDEAECVVD